MWIMGNLLYLHKHCVGKCLEGGSQNSHGWGYSKHQVRFNPVSGTRTTGTNHHQYTGWSSWVGIAGNMGQNPEAYSGTN